MENKHFLYSMLAYRAWQDGHRDGPDATRLVAFAIRNRVSTGWYGGSWIEVLAHADEVASQIPPYKPTNIPDPRSREFGAIIQDIDGIFEGYTKDDISKPRDYSSILAVPPAPVLYYGRADEITNPWFLENISRGPNHKMIAQVGLLCFWN